MAHLQPVADEMIREWPEILEVDRHLKAELASQVPLMREVIDHLTSRGGKKLRPKLVYLCGNFAGEGRGEGRGADPDAIKDVATAVELIHLASLVHDDIIDRSRTRRGKPTVNALWGNHVSVLAGDYLFAKAFSLLTRQNQYGVVEIASATIAVMCEGEIEQAEQAYDCDLSFDQYFRRAERKTACLLAASCRIGAAVSRAPRKVQDALEVYGRQMGYAYQIVDDLLDLTADRKVLGKPVGADLHQGIVTLPVVFLLQDEGWRAKVAPLITARAVTAPVIAQVRKGLRESGAIERSFEVARQCAARAREALAALPAAPERDILGALADYVVTRPS